MAELSDVQRSRLEVADLFLQTAGQAFRSGDYDSSVSRSYYAVFQTIHALPYERNDRGPVGRHERIIDWCVDWNRRLTRLNEAGFLDNQNRDLRGSLGTLLRWRREADYDPWMIDRERAGRALNFARRMFEVVRRIAE